ncbi:DUF6261 family protein [Hoylesella marshii]|uniref:Hemagglutinin protein HagB n=1 Tax=Hoylesella marshii DSM 16973 = JCM 13450 TaxID=862515 RepID=E0NTC4_9BACT|nr:DUF6261 family protein [Hoylesella marshii]EFM01591.1 hemagglutinin protein HagB [Hoylesella marshii DSM 16973 = JCM 13450]
MLLKEIQKARLRNMEHYQFGIHIYEMCKEANIEKLNTLLPALKVCIEGEAEALNLPRGQEFITEIRELDAVRDESYRALQLCVELAKHKRAADIKKAAAEVEKVMKRYPGVATQSNDAETGSIKNLVVDLNDAKVKPHVLKIGAKADLDQLAADNEAFDKMFRANFIDTTLNSAFDIKKLRATTDVAINAVLRRIDSLDDLEPETVGLVALVNRYNRLVENRQTTLAMRKAAAEKKKPSDGEKPKDKKGKKGKKEEPDTGGDVKLPAEGGILVDNSLKTLRKAIIAKATEGEYYLELRLDEESKESFCVNFNPLTGNEKAIDMTRESTVVWALSYNKGGKRLFYADGSGQKHKCDAGTLLYDIDVESGHYQVSITDARLSHGEIGDGKPHTFALRINGTAEVKK